jgi:LSD1 subclass zinc finger protein
MSDASIRIMCPNLKCRRILAVPAKARGKNVRCSGCGAFVQVPNGTPVKPSAAATPNPTGAA